VWKLLRLVGMLSVPALLAGCSGAIAVTAEPFAKSFKRVCISKNDKLTEYTAQQIEANNLALKSILGGYGDCPKPKQVVS
jgi:hypothetical protein